MKSYSQTLLLSVLIGSLFSNVLAADENCIRIGMLKGRTAPEDITILSNNSFIKLFSKEGEEEFRLTKRLDDEIVFAINNSGGESSPDRVEFKFFQNENALIAAIATGQLDFVQIEDEEIVFQIDRATKDVSIRWAYKPPHMVKMIAYNCNHPILRNGLVRQALSYAINKTGIIKKMLKGKADKADGPFLSSSNAYVNKPRAFNYNPKLAIELLQSMGWTDTNRDAVLELNEIPFCFNIFYEMGVSLDENIIRSIKQNLNEIGVDVKPLPLEKKEIKSRLQSGNYDAVLTEHQFEESIQSISEFFFPAHPNSYLNYYSSAIRIRYSLYSQQSTPEKREFYFRSIIKTIIDEQPVTFLYFKWIHYYVINYQNITNFLDEAGKLRPITSWTIRKK